jgi:hypothetical protein
MTRRVGYTTRQAAYDLRKPRCKDLVTKPGRARRYHVPANDAVDRDYETIRIGMQALFNDLGITAIAPHRQSCRSENRNAQCILAASQHTCP